MARLIGLSAAAILMILTGSGQSRAADIHTEAGVVMATMTSAEIRGATAGAHLVTVLTRRIPKPLPLWLAQGVAEATLARLAAEDARGGGKGAVIIIAATFDPRNLVPHVLPAGERASARFRELVADSRALEEAVTRGLQQAREAVTRILPW